MQEERVKELINELQGLRIRQTAIISEIQQAIREETEQNGQNGIEEKTTSTSEFRVRSGSQEATEFALRIRLRNPQRPARRGVNPESDWRP